MTLLESAFDVLRRCYRAVLPAKTRARLTPWILGLLPAIGGSSAAPVPAAKLADARDADGHQAAIEVHRRTLAANEFAAGAYAELAAALRAGKCDAEADEMGRHARDAGLRLIDRGELAAGAAFFAEAARSFPDVCRPYALLYGQIKTLTDAYRAMQVFPRTKALRPLIISITVWGVRYTELFVRYFIPSILSANNIPALAGIRDVHFDIYTTAEFMPAISTASSFRELSRYAQIQMVEFSKEILATTEYERNSSLRYYIFGGFHHVSIERARALKADIICIAPDGVHSDGSFYNYARLVDQGYKAVMFTATRGQAETLRPILDRMRDEATQSLTLPSRALVALAARHVHHDFQRYIMSKDNNLVPEVLPCMFFPYPRGFHVRCFHLHPIIIAAEALEKNIVFDYHTVDSNLVSRLFPDPDEWRSIKIIDDTDDGVMMDLSYSYEQIPYPEIHFTPELLVRHLPVFRPNHFWHFSHRIDYHCDETLTEIGTFDRRPDGSLVPKRIPLSSALAMGDEDIAAWFEAHRTKDQREA